MQEKKDKKGLLYQDALSDIHPLKKQMTIK